MIPNLTEQTIKEKMAAAAAEPAVPEDLVERTVVRGNAIEAGREAEKRLALVGGTLSGEETAELLARGVVGRLMLGQKPPKNVTAEQMVVQLKNQESFRRLMGEPVEYLLHGLKTGEIIRRISQPAAHTAEECQSAPAAEAGEVKLTQPEISVSGRIL